VDRPSSGHRRHDADSVTVVDLIRRQQGPIRIPSAREAATVEFVDDLLGAEPEPAYRPRGWLAKSAKLAGLALGSLALCGSVYAASMLTQHRPQAAATAPADDMVLTGVGALRPDAVAAQLSGEPRLGTTPIPAPSLGSIATGKATGTVIGSAPATTTPSATSQDERARLGALSPAQLVRTFYRLVATDPGLASELISPALLHGESSGFDDAWSSMSQVQVESVTPESARSVEAVVRMLEPDGSWLREVELVHVTSGTSPLINGAELLSAQHG
jgi:hypothetical protein